MLHHIDSAKGSIAGNVQTILRLTSPTKQAFYLPTQPGHPVLGPAKQGLKTTPSTSGRAGGMQQSKIQHSKAMIQGFLTCQTATARMTAWPGGCGLHLFRVPLATTLTRGFPLARIFGSDVHGGLKQRTLQPEGIKSKEPKQISTLDLL